MGNKKKNIKPVPLTTINLGRADAVGPWWDKTLQKVSDQIEGGKLDALSALARIEKVLSSLGKPKEALRQDLEEGYVLAAEINGGEEPYLEIYEVSSSVRRMSKMCFIRDAFLYALRRVERDEDFWGKLAEGEGNEITDSFEQFLAGPYSEYEAKRCLYLISYATEYLVNEL